MTTSVNPKQSTEAARRLESLRAVLFFLVALRLVDGIASCWPTNRRFNRPFPSAASPSECTMGRRMG